MTRTPPDTGADPEPHHETSSVPLVVVQARAGSTRLPGKVLAEVAGFPMLGFQLRRLAGLRARVVAATGDRPIDDAVAEVAAEAGVPVVRGPEDDVLGRYALALRDHPAATVVRLTGDCPLTDPAIVAAALDLHVRVGAHYTSNVLPRSYPKGLDVEVVAADALLEAAGEATEGPDREHVTPFLYRHPGRFRLANLHSGRDLGEEWWTVDTAEDLERVRALVARLEDPLRASWTDVLAVAEPTTRRGPGLVHLRPLPTTEVGVDPWPRRWAAEVDGTTVGTVQVLVGGDGADPRCTRRLAVDPAWEAAAAEALDRLLAGDQQSRP